MKWQLHWQLDRTGENTVFKSEKDFPDGTKIESREIYDWVENTVKAYPLPAGAIWLMLNERDPRFIKQGDKSHV